MNEFLTWHYTHGLALYLRRWRETLSYVVHYFSLPLLIFSLFSTWKRMIDTNQVGFNPSKFFEKFMFNLVSRMVGAMTRLTLFFFGMVLLGMIAFVGAIGVSLWLVFPFISYPLYLKYEKHPARFAHKLRTQIKLNSHNQIHTLFNNEAGEFVLGHIGLSLDEVITHSKVGSEIISHEDAQSYKELLSHYTSAQFLDEHFMQQKHILYEDFLQAAAWWDDKRRETALTDEETHFGKPGIGLELLFGYTPTLNKVTSDLGSPKSFSHHLIGREEVVARIERALTGGTSVMVVGAPGVGKKTVVMEFAYQAAQGWLGSQMAYRRVLELDVNALFAQAGGLDGKKGKITEVLAEASYAGNIILAIRDIHKLTNPAVEGLDLTDIFEKFLEKKDLKIIAVTSQMEYERFIAGNMRLRKFLDVIEIPQPNKNDAMEILMAAAKRIESTRRITILMPALRAILDGSDRYITETPFPEKALELLDSVVTYITQKGKKEIGAEDVSIVLSEKTGVSFATLSQKEKTQLGNLEAIIHERLVNQEAAVSMIAKSLRSRQAGVRDENRPVGSFMFLGPTGVGKTQTAKVLSRVYYGSEHSILRFDMAEYSSREGLERLIGSQSRNVPGALTTAIKNKPASLLLLDEIEKAPQEIYNLLLTLLDEGYLTDAFGRKIDCRHLFIIATSNAGAEFIREQVGAGVGNHELQSTVLEHIQREKVFSPEFLNRFDGVVVFEPLTHSHLIQVAKLQLAELAENLRRKNIFLDVTDQLAQKVAEDGFDPAFGARAMRRILDLTIGDVIGAAILRGELASGDHFVIIPGTGKGEYSIQQAQNL